MLSPQIFYKNIEEISSFGLNLSFLFLGICQALPYLQILHVDPIDLSCPEILWSLFLYLQYKNKNKMLFILTLAYAIIIEKYHKKEMCAFKYSNPKPLYQILFWEFLNPN